MALYHNGAIFLGMKMANKTNKLIWEISKALINRDPNMCIVLSIILFKEKYWMELSSFWSSFYYEKKYLVLNNTALTKSKFNNWQTCAK